MDASSEGSAEQQRLETVVFDRGGESALPRDGVVESIAEAGLGESCDGGECDNTELGGASRTKSRSVNE